MQSQEIDYTMTPKKDKISGYKWTNQDIYNVVQIRPNK